MPYGFALLHERPWISPWIKSMSDKLDITIRVIASQLSGHSDVISNRFGRDQQNKNWASETWGRHTKNHRFFPSFMDSLCHIRNERMYVLEWRTVPTLTWDLFWCLFSSLLLNSGNKHQNYPLMSAETVHHSSTYIILCKCSIVCASTTVALTSYA